MAARKPIVLGTGGKQEISPSDTLAVPALSVTGAVTGATLALSGAAQAQHVSTNEAMHVAAYGVVADVRMVAGAGLTMAAGGPTPTLTSTLALPMTSADIGKSIIIPGIGVGGQPYTTTITGVVVGTNSTTITVANPAATAISANSDLLYWGTDDTANFRAAVASGKNLRLHDATMLLSGQVNCSTPGQVIEGCAPAGGSYGASILVATGLAASANAAFDSTKTSGNALFYVANLGYAPTFRGFRVVHAQTTKPRIFSAATSAAQGAAGTTLTFTDARLAALGTGAVTGWNAAGPTIGALPSTTTGAQVENSVTNVGLSGGTYTVTLAAATAAALPAGASVTFYCPGDLVAYPPTFFFFKSAQGMLDRVRVVAGTVGLRAYGNCGGLAAYDFHSACLRTNVWIDGSLDTIRFTNLHVFPFELTARQNAFFWLPACQGLRLGRMDDINVTNGLFLCGTQLVAAPGQCRNSVDSVNFADNTTYAGFAGGYFTGTDFDSICNCYLGGDTTGGTYLHFTGCSWSSGALGLLDENSNPLFTATNNWMVRQAGGHCLLANCMFYLGTPQLSGYALLFEAGTAAETTLSGCHVEFNGSSATWPYPHCAIGNTGAAHALSIAGGSVTLKAKQSGSTTNLANVPAGVGLVALYAGRGTISGLVFDYDYTAAAAPTGLGIYIPGDYLYTVSNNELAGLGLSVPARPTNVCVANNSTVAQAYSGSASVSTIVGGIKVVQFRVTADSSGNAVFSHGIDASCYPFLRVDAWAKSTNGNLVAITNIQTNSGGLSIIAGASFANAAVMVIVEYSRGQLTI